jgi:hypothetical protein
MKQHERHGETRAVGMLKTDKDIVSGYIHKEVWSGFYEPDEVVEHILDYQLVEQLDRRWLRAQVKREFKRKEQEAATWGEVTDCDRLDRVFDALEDQNIIALQNAGYTQDDGIDDISEVYHDAGGEDSDIIGYCFYHGQDLERVIESGKLYLTYGDILGDDERGEAIGRRILGALEAEGFKVKWNGSIRERILITGIKWQRR